MSRTYEIACTKCRKRLWIAQEGARRNLYSTDEAIEALRDFLFDHAGHPLVFDEGIKLWDRLGEFEDVTPKDES